uniref:HAT C-terminal dimerisation domain-containing protein n=1 Tax=Solanum lycopersicum TaxID=4081 RepID=A0A3Q7JAV0_SOLLC
MDGSHLHIRCMTHIINLIFQDGTKKSGKKFQECCEDENLSKKSVCLEVSTRWNSTYMILSKEGAIVEYAYRDIGLALHLMFVDIRLRGIKRITKFVEIFFILLWRYQDHYIWYLLNQLISSEDQVLAKIAENMKEKFDKYWGDTEKMNKMIFIPCKHKSKKGGQSSKSKLVKCLDEETEIEKLDFDVLLWWKVNSPIFPFLSEMARDVLAIPVSSVASMCAFSNGGIILDSFWSSLTPKLCVFKIGFGVSHNTQVLRKIYIFLSNLKK